MASRDSKRTIKQWRKAASGIYFPGEVEYLEHAIWEEKQSMVGFLSIIAFPGTNRHEAVELNLGRNLIVDVGRASVASLQRDTVAGVGASGVYDLGYLALGNGSNGGALTPAAGDTALTAETTGAPTGVARKALAVTTPPPGPPYVTNLWTAQIGPTEYNVTTGAPALNQINEAALYCLNGSVAGTMYSMRTFANQLKSAGITFEFRWSIIF